MSTAFTPTPCSIPPKNNILRLSLPNDIPVNFTPLNPITFLLRATLLYPQKIALKHPESLAGPLEYTFEVWTQRVQNLAYALIKHGIKPGDRVAVIAPNCPLIADAHQAAVAIGVVLCPINTRLTKPEVDYILEHSGSKLILIDVELHDLVKDAKVPVIVSHDTGRYGDPYEDFLEEGREYSRERGWPGLVMYSDETAAATLCYTSGTTGRPKGVAGTFRGSTLGAIANAYQTKMGLDSTYLWVLPMFHASGWTYPWATTFSMATQLFIRQVKFPQIWHHFLNSGVTHYCGAPTVQIGIINSPEARRLDRSIQAIIAGSAPTAHLIGELEKKNIHVTHVYGLTETYGPFTQCFPQPEWKDLPLSERAKLIARQGQSYLLSDEARVVYQPEEHENPNSDEWLDKPLVDVPADGKTVGEIVVRGNLVMREYFNDEVATRKAFRGRHFGSGDLAVRHPDGSVAIVDRAKDLLISGGENASTLAIEQELVTHPDVLELAVVARPHFKWGERAQVFVVLHPHALDKWPDHLHDEFENHLKAHAKPRLPGFAQPEWVKVVPELPKTSTGKIQKNVLREHARNLEDSSTGPKAKAKL